MITIVACEIITTVAGDIITIVAGDNDDNSR